MRGHGLVGAPTFSGILGAGAARRNAGVVPAGSRRHRECFTGWFGQRSRDEWKLRRQELVGAANEVVLCSGPSLGWPVCVAASVRVSEVGGRSRVRPVHVPRANNVGAPTFSFWNCSEVAA
jgi:hypothetical protein